MGEPPWEETTTLDHGRGQELLVKEALHIQMIAAEECFNRDGGLEVPGCWTVWHTIRNKKKKKAYIGTYGTYSGPEEGLFI